MPSVSVNTPVNGSNQFGNNTIVFNISNTDADGDNIDVIVASIFSGPFNSRNYLRIRQSITNETELIFNRTVGLVDALDTDLIRWFKLDHQDFFGEMDDTGIGKWVDFSNNHANGTNGISQSPKDCLGEGRNPITENCMDFDGGSDAILVENASGIDIISAMSDMEFTIANWIYSDISAQRIVIAKGVGTGAGGFWEQRGNSLLIRNSTSGIQCNATSTIPVGTDEWHHYAFAANGSGISVYEGGVFDNHVDCPGVFINVTRYEVDDTYETCIGSFNSVCSATSWDGMIDEIVIMNRTMTATEIQDLANMTSSSFNWSVRMWDSPDGQAESNFTYTFNGPCVYISGDWLLSFADNCVITSNVIGDALAEVLFDSTVGTFTINNGVIISGFNFLFAPDTGLITGIGSGAYLP